MSKVWLITGSARGLGRDITEVPVHRILRSAALHALGRAEATRQQAAKDWAPVSTSIDIEGVDLSFLSREGQS